MSFLGLITRRRAQRLIDRAVETTAAEATRRQIVLYEDRNAKFEEVHKLRRLVGDMRMDAMLIKGLLSDERMPMARRIDYTRQFADLMIRLADRSVPR